MTDHDDRDRVPWPLVIMAALAAILSFAFNQASSHDEPAIGSTNDDPDSVRVILEFDPDGDGTYQIRHVYNERVGIWDQSTQGFMRITLTTEHAGLPDTTTSERGIFWRDLQPTGRDSMGRVDLSEFSSFGQSYGRPKVILDSGARMWDVWYVDEATGDSTLTGTFYLYSQGLEP